MARITVDDCLVQIPNRFKLTLAATYRARELAQGHGGDLALVETGETGTTFELSLPAGS